MNKARGYYGELQNVDGEPVLCFERQFKHPVECAWQALLDPQELSGWFPCTIEGERALGATLRFVFQDDDTLTSTGTIIEFDPPRLLAYTWDREVVRWELQPNTQGCLLLFTITLDERYS